MGPVCTWLMRCKFDPIELAIDSDIRNFFEPARVGFAFGARSFSVLENISDAFDNLRELAECVSIGASSFWVSTALRRNNKAVFWARCTFRKPAFCKYTGRWTRFRRKSCPPIPPSVKRRRLFDSAALAITCGSTASNMTKGRLGEDRRVCTAFSMVMIRSVSQVSKASTMPTSRLCCFVKASRHCNREREREEQCQSARWVSVFYGDKLW